VIPAVPNKQLPLAAWNYWKVSICRTFSLFTLICILRNCSRLTLCCLPLIICNYLADNWMHQQWTTQPFSAHRFRDSPQECGEEKNNVPNQHQQKVSIEKQDKISNVFKIVLCTEVITIQTSTSERCESSSVCLLSFTVYIRKDSILESSFISTETQTQQQQFWN
jgi:hypothetical protein